MNGASHNGSQSGAQNGSESGTQSAAPLSAQPGQRPKLFYGWYIVGAGFLTQLMMGMLMFHSFGTYVTLMQADFGWSRTTFSIAFAMQRAESGILGPIQGWAIDTYGPRRIMILGMVLFAAGFMMLSQVDTKWTFYLAFMLIAIGASLGSFLALTVAIVNWFRKRRTMALGLLSLGFAVGGFAATPMALLIEGIGWRAAAFGSGVAVLLIGLPLASLVKHRPEDHGLLPDGAPSHASLVGDSDEEEDDDDDLGMTTREALRTPAFWLISFGQASALLVIGALMVHLVVYVSDDLGYGLALATFAITVQTIGQVVGQLLGTYYGDRLPKRPLIVAALLGHAVAMFVLALASTLPLVYLAVAINGTAWGLRAPLQMAIRADYFGRKSFGTIMGFSSLVIMSGMIIGPTFSGVMYDQTGSYQFSFIVLSIFAALGAVLFAFAKPPAARPPREPTAKPPTPVLAPTEALGRAPGVPAAPASPAAPRVPTAPRAEQQPRAQQLPGAEDERRAG